MTKSLASRLERLEQSLSSQSEQDVYQVVRDNPDPVDLCRELWPGVTLTDYQGNIARSTDVNNVTCVVAGHQLGKDFISGFVALRVFLTQPELPCRIVATSVDARHLAIFWGELEWFIENARYPLSREKGGPLVVQDTKVKRLVGGRECPKSYLIRRVAKKPEALAGHHAPRTLLIVDEASGVEDEAYKRARTWAKRSLVIGNPYQCANFFFEMVEQGDVLANEPTAEPKQ